jgi:hypothetical protein
VARRAFVRVRDLGAVELVDRVAAGLRGGLPQGLLAAEVMAWQVRGGALMGGAAVSGWLEFDVMFGRGLETRVQGTAGP